MLVIAAVVHEFTRIAESTVPRLLVVLANVWLVVHDERQPYVRRSTQGSVRTASLFTGNSVLFAEACPIIHVVVHSAILLIIIEPIHPISGRFQNFLAHSPPIQVPFSVNLYLRGGASIASLLKTSVAFKGEHLNLFLVVTCGRAPESEGFLLLFDLSYSRCGRFIIIVLILRRAFSHVASAERSFLFEASSSPTAGSARVFHRFSPGGYRVVSHKIDPHKRLVECELSSPRGDESNETLVSVQVRGSAQMGASGDEDSTDTS
mmetsp:Transcript_20672/g.51500  ORF Transcript_20672/g.51500 Transcript_20672/m.51500 type:complete len:263 (+) Transcript_20672:1867-2655(+)